MIKYVAQVKSDWLRAGEISKIEVQRETQHKVVLADGTMVNKRSGWMNYFDSFDEAKQFLIDETEREIELLKSQLRQKKETLEARQRLVEE